MSKDFNWSTDDALVVRGQEAVAVYWNDFGQAVIRQEGQWPDDEDVFVIINRALSKRSSTRSRPC